MDIKLQVSVKDIIPILEQYLSAEVFRRPVMIKDVAVIDGNHAYFEEPVSLEIKLTGKKTLADAPAGEGSHAKV